MSQPRITIAKPCSPYILITDSSHPSTSSIMGRTGEILTVDLSYRTTSSTKRIQMLRDIRRLQDIQGLQMLQYNSCSL